MRALVFEAGSAGVSDVSFPRVSDGEVLVAVSRTGMCGTDLGIVRKGRPQVDGPVVLGHEIVGVLAGGTRVAIDPFLACGSCSACIREDTNLCENLRIVGVHVDGGFAESLAVAERQIVTLPDTISDVQASVVEPVATALHAWRKVEAGNPRSVGVIGAGAIGLSVMAVAAAHGIKATAADVDDAMLAHASLQGAAASGETLVGTFDVVFDCVGLETTRRQAVEATRAGGTVVMIGLAGPDLVVPGRSMVTFERTIHGSFGYRHQDFVDAVDIAATMPTGWVGGYLLDEITAILAGDSALPRGIAKAQLVAERAPEPTPSSSDLTEEKA